MAAALRMALMASPVVHLSRLRSSRCSLLRWPIVGSTAARRFIHRQSVLAAAPRRRLSTWTVSGPA